VEAADTGSGDRDWRLQARLEGADAPGMLSRAVGRFRGPDVAEEAKAGVPRDVVITHDGALLFAYAVDHATLAEARRAIEDVLKRDAITSDIRISHWDDRIDDWLQVEPPASGAQRLAEDAVRRDAQTRETRTIVASLGKEIRVEFEQSMLDSAARLGLECSVLEHPHLLTTQVGFTVTGPKRNIDEFSRGLTAEEAASIRTERAVMLSPL
jgi:hypothetical protein